MEVQNGRYVSGNTSLFYSAVSYKKTGGSTIYAIFILDAGSALYNSSTYSIAAGQTKAHSFGGRPVPSGCRVVGGMHVDGQGKFWTPALNPC
ncbi:hypothetical protein [Streptomyces thermolilacinus]|uniref:hypothetical protein n=1 Tax=Streptomyces thermolilacinus TaxID=285540 RepID=UPI0033E1890D